MKSQLIQLKPHKISFSAKSNKRNFIKYTTLPYKDSIAKNNIYTPCAKNSILKKIKDFVMDLLRD